MQDIRVGLAGLGFMGAAHAAALSTLPGAKLQAVCGRNPERLAGDFSGMRGNLDQPFGKLDFGGSKIYTDWRKMLNDEQIDAVDICLPTPLHADIAVAALQTGKHVLCEKPMALTDADCRRMLDAAAQTGRVLMVGQVLRFFPAYQRLFEAVQSGRYGRVLQALLIRQTALPDWSSWLTDSTQSGGAVLDLLIHDIDQALWLFGSPNSVAAKSMGDADTLMASLIYTGGPEVRIQGGWFAPGSAFSMSFRVRFEHAELEFSAGELWLQNAQGQRTALALDRVNPYRVQMEYFLECCRNSFEPAYCPPSESAAAVQLACQLRQAALSR